MIQPCEMMSCLMLAAATENKALIPVVAVVVAVLVGMFMGRRSQRPGAKASWWVGLVILLVFLSVFFGYSSVLLTDRTEVRYADRPAVITEVRESLHEAGQEMKSNLEKGMQELQSALKQLPGGEKPKGRTGNRVVMNVPAAPHPPKVPMPQGPVKFVVRVDGIDQSKNPDVVKQKIWEKGLTQVHDWIKDRTSVADRYVFVDLSMLKKMNVFPEGIQPEQYEEELPDGSKEKMYRGEATMVLSPEVQRELLNHQISEWSSHLQEEMLRGQAFVSGVVLMVTLLAALLGAYRMYRHWLRFKVMPGGLVGP